MHDFNENGLWEPAEIAQLYGLYRAPNEHLPQGLRDIAVRAVLDPMDTNRDGRVSRPEFEAFLSSGGVLPDLNYGPGHHGDDEYEYEIHHWEQYHDEDTTLEDLTHPEDIEHFKKHEDDERAQAVLQDLQGRTIVLENIPAKFRRVEDL